ncbi:MAG: CPBP family intramembrane metalloprotease [Candidatus Hydrogenedentes bacterium]|nr:CPBP family intramembrane metalloprotease [Candidatus Hydrogenedentota bacterium]
MSENAVPPPLPETEPTAPDVPVRTEPRFRDLAIALAIIWCCNFLLQIVGVGTFFAIRYAQTGEMPNMDLPPTLLFALVLLDWAVALPIAFYFSCVRSKRSFRAGFGLISVPARVASQSLTIGIVGAIVAGVVMTLFATGEAPIYEIAVDESADGSPTLLFSFLIFAVMVPPLEELYYRGFIFPILRRSLSPAWAIGIVSIWFALLHAAQLWGEWAGLGVVVVMGTVWTIQRHVYDSLTPSIISHWTYNTALVVLQVAAGI